MNMKNLFLAIVLLMLVPGGALAMDHSKMADDKAMDHSKMDSSSMNKMDMSGMDHGSDSMMMLGNEEVDGVKAMFHLSDVKAEMAKAGQPFTHHLMVNFVYVKTGKAIERGQVAVKVKTPAGMEGKAQMLMGMDGHFGVDLTLDQAGNYQFNIASKLEDGKKRKFNPHHEL